MAKLSGIVISLLCVVLVGLSDMGNNEESITFSNMIIGDILSILGAIFYVFYTALLKYKADDIVDMKIFLGFVGLINFFIMMPIMALIHFINMEPFELPPIGLIWAMLFLNAFLGTFLSDYLWIYVVLFTSPLVVTLGLSLTIPFAMVGDVLINHKTITTIYCCGALFVIIGFFMVNSATYQENVNDAKQNDSLASRLDA